MTLRVQMAVEDLHGKTQTSAVRGFDLVMVPLKPPRWLSAAPPRVLVRVTDLVDAATVNEAWSNAVRARVHVQKSPLMVLLLGARFTRQAELQRALELLGRQPKSADGPSEVLLAAVDTADWSARVASDAPALHKLIDRLKM
jgi:hypothetical protein